MIRFALSLTVIAAMFLTVAAIAKADRGPQFPSRPQPVVSFGPHTLGQAVENLTVLATCQWKSARCAAHPEPHPSARRRP